MGNQNVQNQTLPTTKLIPYVPIVNTVSNPVHNHFRQAL